MTQATQRLSRKEVLDRFRRLKADKVATLKAFAAHKDGNKLEFFDKPPNKGPNPLQAPFLQAFLDPSFKTLGISSGNQSGKTTALTIITLSVMFGKYLWNNQSLLHLFPHKNARKVRYIGQDWHDHIASVVIPELEVWWPQSMKVEKHGNGIITDTFWKDVQTGSTLQIMSNRQDPKLHEGWRGDLIIYDEPPRHDIYVANARGLMERRGREVFACTLLDEPWIDKEIIKKVGADGGPDKSVFWLTGSTYDNVGYGLTERGIAEFINKLSENEIQARIYGIPSYLQGLVYPMFNRKEHLFPHFQIPLDWMVDIAIDVHPRKQQAVQFMATDPREDRYICDEIWDYGDGTQLGEMIVRKVHQHDYRVNRCVIDPLAKGDSNNAETTYQKIARVLLRHDIPLEVGSKDVDSGILSVKKHLKGPNGKPSLFLLDNCRRTLYEIESHMWDAKNPGKILKEDDDMMENLRRLCLLDTKYVDPDEYAYAGGDRDRGRNKVTGY